MSHSEKLRFLSQYKRVSDPTNKASVSKQYATYKKFPLYLQRNTSGEKIKELKKRGFFTTSKGVIIDGPRDAKRKPIKGAKLSIQSDGTIKWSVKDRRDYIVGLTKAEKKEFARDPNKLIARKLAELKKKNPTLARKKNIQVRLQWGAYQATKDFSTSHFTKRYPQFGKENDKKNVEDRLTGLHFVVHQRAKKPNADHLTGVHFTVKGHHGKKRK